MAASFIDGDRAEMARQSVEPTLRAMIKRAGLAYPPKQLFFRAFKRERILEVWGAASATSEFKKLKSYKVLAASGKAGPKRAVGDYQVPEGWYHVDRFNPKSLFHLSLGLNYPNASDRIFATNPDPGSDIFIHGNAKSIGCLAIGDPAIEEVYTLTRAAKNRVYVLILPGRKNPAAGTDFFWDQIFAINDAFEKAHRLPIVSIDRKGFYHVR